MDVLPEWINAIATTLTFGAASFAAFFAWQSLQRERRDARRQAAAGLAAWWVKRPSEGRDRWGVLLLNASDKVFTDVAVLTAGDNRAAGDAIRVPFLPPGRYFVESRTEGAPWGLKEVVSADEHPAPLVDSSRHHVDRVIYTDMAQGRWAWSPKDGLLESGSRRSVQRDAD